MVIRYRKDSNRLGFLEVEDLIKKAVLTRQPSALNILYSILHFFIDDQGKRAGDYIAYSHWGSTHIVKHEKRDLDYFKDRILEVAKKYDLVLEKTVERKGNVLGYGFRLCQDDSFVDVSKIKTSLIVTVGYSPLKPGSCSYEELYNVMVDRMAVARDIACAVEF